MRLVEFYDGSLEKFLALESKSNDTLYFLTNGQIYKGDILCTNIRIISDFPEIADAEIGALYISSIDGSMKYCDGEDYIAINDITTVDEITADTADNTVPTTAAIKKYVTEKQDSNLEFNTYLDFPTTGKQNIIYIDKTNNKLYRWSVEELKYYCVGSDYTEINLIDGGFE